MLPREYQRLEKRDGIRSDNSFQGFSGTNAPQPQAQGGNPALDPTKLA